MLRENAGHATAIYLYTAMIRTINLSYYCHLAVHSFNIAAIRRICFQNCPNSFQRTHHVKAITAIGPKFQGENRSAAILQWTRRILRLSIGDESAICQGRCYFDRCHSFDSFRRWCSDKRRYYVFVKQYLRLFATFSHFCS